MAPPKSGNGANNLQKNRPRPTASRGVVPAIPLPYVQKRQQQQAARAKAEEEAAAVVVKATPVAPPSPPQEPAPPVVNGTGPEPKPDKVEEVEEVREVSVPTEPTTPTVEVDTKKEESEQVAEEVNGTEEMKEEATQQESVSDEPAEPVDSTRFPIPTTQDDTSPPSEVQANGSRAIYHMPPDFVPANNQHNGMNYEAAQYPPSQVYNGPQAMPHTHPSNGNVMFGTHPESDNSSPAPPLSGGHMPPPPFQHAPHGSSRHYPHQSNGGHSHHLSNGYSPMVPQPPPGYPVPQQRAWTGGDFQRGPMTNFAGPADNFGANPYTSSAPHSFHGSQSSAHEQESGPPFYNHFPTAVINGSNGHIDDVRVYQSRSGKRPNGNNGAPFVVPPPVQALQYPTQGDDYDGLGMYLQSQFADSTFADWTLELRYSDDRAPPVRIPGHNIMFARSPELQRMMLAHGRDSEGVRARTLLIESSDRYLRSDAFWLAMQRLYGAPLLEIGREVVGIPHSISVGPMPGTPAERFDLGLGYAAAGRILQMPIVTSRGIGVASHFVDWNTLEKAFDFALDGGLDRSWTLSSQARLPPTYGPAVNMLIHASLTFMAQNFPAGFQLDTSAPEPARNRRLPAVPEARSAIHNPRLSKIKFGDHSAEEQPLAVDSPTAILSKTLLNLPFHLIKFFMESQSLQLALPARRKLLESLVQEREKRRLKVIESQSSPAEFATLAEEWESVYFEERVEPVDSNMSAPMLTRVWKELRTPSA